MPRIAPKHVFAIAAAILALGACQPNTAQKTQAQGYRAANTAMYSTAGLPAARLIGNWGQVANFGAAQPCTAAPAITFSPDASGVQTAYDLCLGSQRAAASGRLTSAGAMGRYVLPNFPAPIWVLWIDQDNRTLVLGTPNGRFGIVLAKSRPSADHLRAAREVLAWNGYDLTQFHLY